ncbi:LEAF RUST 10 DISEASE-RESISTANCE LOCUS RECEPTOR-LIKE PROTEIN KINASE-like 2.1 [Camellia lanceoleosa]|uniref:LEAF RUST 10 DISEASE-RESISTANCE LOCUS RECEPTOR-LIKE PROTEIN KINASE-like 2.1 n=1 Tax=Camellia lanceoleosa TaxID=1840588 RepID=A0ACC0FCQ0_9ERIC|nr:LEAF RUST 10 DISEASE-RESISTANCE LOCUS RECEPTOR-LIKE PROTEIN KINASE-like 2.1 [Camellia lanceoleosa]
MRPDLYQPTTTYMPLLSMPPLCVNLIIAIFLFLVSSPTSHGADDEYCHEKTYNCGQQIKEIGYPFWGEDRPQLCGVQGFELTCHPNESTTIVIEKQEFRVLHINQSAHNMTIALADLWDNLCPKELSNTTLNWNLLDDGSNPLVVNLTLVYDCPLIFAPPYHPVEDRSHFQCQVGAGGQISNINFFVTDESIIPPNCKSRIKVPVFQEALDAFWVKNAITVQELVKQGFGVDYCVVCKASGGKCGTDTTTNQAICPFQGGKKQLTLNVAIVVILIVVGAAILVTCLSLIFWVTKKTSTYKSIFFWRKSTMADDNVEAFLKINGSLVPQRYSYSRIKKVTNSFQDKLGKGGYGDVYKGKLLDGRLVAVKLLNETKGSNGEEFINEVASISRTSHVNIVCLVGYCFEGCKRALIYEYMPNGSLEKFLHTNKSHVTNDDLEWKTMHKIAVGIARGLEYLHRGCTTRIFHFDIKPHNILLDEDFCPKISDFGLAKLCSNKESIVSMLHARGTIGYIAPEVFSRNFGRVSHKADVYSYGMLVLEMVHGRENIGESVEHTSDLYFPHSIYKKLECDGDIGLHGIESEEDEKVARKMILVGLCCIQANPSDRPAINNVIEMLEGNLESLQIPPEPFLSSPSRTPIASYTIQISQENESCEVESM